MGFGEKIGDIMSSARKSKKAFIEMPLHKRVKAIAAPVAKKMESEYGKRAISIRKGDTVKIVRGSFKGKEGKVIEVILSKLKIIVDSAKRKKSDGTEFNVAIDPSKVVIVDLNKSDSKRFGHQKKRKVEAKTEKRK